MLKPADRSPPFETAPSPEDGLVVVRPVGGGWAVASDCWGERLLFSSGAAAESQARRISECLAAIGFDARVDVYDRQNVLVGTFRLFAKL